MRLRATAVLALALVLTGCGSSTGGSSGDAVLTGATAVGQALPTLASLPEGWARDSDSRKPRTSEGEEAAADCRKNLDTSCAGLSAIGVVKFERADDPQSDVAFSLMAFDTPENAEVVAKAIVADQRHGEDQDISVDAGADTTVAFAAGRDTTVVMRVGAVVVWLTGYLPQGADVSALAKVPVRRVGKVAEGENPDAG